MNAVMRAGLTWGRNKIRTVRQGRRTQRLSALLDGEDFAPIVNHTLGRIRSIVFIIPGMGVYSGGHTSILRCGTALAKHGYRVYYMTSIVQKKDDMEANARINLSHYEGEILERDDQFCTSDDVVIATSWATVYYAKKLPGYKMYFIQDYEPYFYPMGDEYLLARKTYAYQLHMISLGGWNAELIQRETGNEVQDVLPFPFEPKEYEIMQKDYKAYKTKTVLKLAVYVKQDAKRLPIILPVLLGALQKDLLKRGITLEILYYGSSADIHYKYGRNLGQLDKKALKKLYIEADFGMVASMTNVSLVPFEMVACGLPVIEVFDGSARYFFPEDSMIFTNLNAQQLSLTLYDILHNTDQLVHMMQSAQDYIRQFSWEKTGDAFCHVVERIVAQ